MFEAGREGQLLFPILQNIGPNIYQF